MKKSFFLFAISLFLISFFSIFVFGCRNDRNTNLWKKYSYPEYKGYLYTQEENGKLNAVICGEMSGIRGAMKLDHKCTHEQYEGLHEKLIEQNGKYLGKVHKPNTWGFPDLSAYLTFVFSYDELHEIWVSFGLEEDEE